jgi:Outer membrane protein beta-barrel domain
MIDNLLQRSAICGFLTLGLAAGPNIAWAQGSAPDAATSGIRSGSVDAAFNVGWSNIPGQLDPSDGNSHPNFGGSAGVNLSRNVGVLGEFTYQPMKPLNGVGFNTQLFGGALRYSLGRSKVSPYLVFAGGGARLTGSESGVSATATGNYLGSGAGASIFLRRNWGLRPEFRYNYLHLSLAGVTQNSNISQLSVGFFFQFGGRPSRSQIASATP